MSISIHELLAVARESEGVKAVQGDAMLCEKRFAPDTRYMVEFLVLKQTEKFEEQREEYEMEPGATFWFEEELQYCLDDWKPSKLSMAEEVEAVRGYVQAMKNFKGE